MILIMSEHLPLNHFNVLHITLAKFHSAQPWFNGARVGSRSSERNLANGGDADHTNPEYSSTKVLGFVPSERRQAW